MENVKIYFGDPWYDPASVKVRNVFLFEVWFLEFTFETYNTWHAVSHNTEIANDLILEADFEFECELRVDNYYEGERNILRFSNTDGNSGVYGDRTLLLNTYNSGGWQWIDIYTDSQDDDWGHLTWIDTPLDGQFTLMVRVKGDEREIWLNGYLQFTDWVGTRIEQRRAKFYGSDAFFEAAGVSIENVRWTNLFE